MAAVLYKLLLLAVLFKKAQSMPASGASGDVDLIIRDAVGDRDPAPGASLL